jgi:hypothetical protein
LRHSPAANLLWTNFLSQRESHEGNSLSFVLLACVAFVSRGADSVGLRQKVEKVGPQEFPKSPEVMMGRKPKSTYASSL